MHNMFLTKEYQVLDMMDKNLIKVADKEYCPLGQGEIAEKLGVSRAVVNKIFTELRNANYITMITRGKWKLSDTAVNMLNVTRNL